MHFGLQRSLPHWPTDDGDRTRDDVGRCGDGDCVRHRTDDIGLKKALFCTLVAVTAAADYSENVSVVAANRIPSNADDRTDHSHAHSQDNAFRGLMLFGAGAAGIRFRQQQSPETIFVVAGVRWL